MSARDRLKHATVDTSTLGIPLCQWERDSHGGLIAGWRCGCLVGSGTPTGGVISPHARSGARLGQASARRAERLITAAVIVGLYLIVGLTLVLASAGTEPL
jgi:hypothetical protein